MVQSGGVNPVQFSSPAKPDVLLSPPAATAKPSKKYIQEYRRKKKVRRDLGSPRSLPKYPWPVKKKKTKVR